MGGTQGGGHTGGVHRGGMVDNCYYTWPWPGTRGPIFQDPFNLRKRRSATRPSPLQIENALPHHHSPLWLILTRPQYHLHTAKQNRRLIPQGLLPHRGSPHPCMGRGLLLSKKLQLVAYANLSQVVAAELLIVHYGLSVQERECGVDVQLLCSKGTFSRPERHFACCKPQTARAPLLVYTHLHCGDAP